MRKGCTPKSGPQPCHLSDSPAILSDTFTNPVRLRWRCTSPIVKHSATERRDI
jgi:hypothetical protein